MHHILINVEENKVECTPPVSLSSGQLLEEADSEMKWNVEDNGGHATGSERTIGMDPKKETNDCKQTYCCMALHLLILSHSGKTKEPKNSQTLSEDSSTEHQCGKNVPTQPNTMKVIEPNTAYGPSVLSNVLKQEQSVGITKASVIHKQSQLEIATQGQQSSKGLFQTFIAAAWGGGKESEAKMDPKKILNVQGSIHTSVTANPSLFQDLILLLRTEVSCGQMIMYLIYMYIYLVVESQYKRTNQISGELHR